MDRTEIRHHLTHSPPGELMMRADLVRAWHHGDDVHLRGIIEFSNHCIRNCAYCGLRRDNRNLRRYRLAPDAIVAVAMRVAAAGVATVVLQSGDDFAYSAADLAGIIRQIKARADVAVTLSVGERPFSDYEIWRRAGADRYLLKHETANPDLYARLHPGQRLEARLAILGFLKELGYQTGNGVIVGLPGQTLEDLAQDVLLTRRLNADMCGIGPFMPHSATPLGSASSGPLDTTLRMIALIRLLCPHIHLPATTALATLAPGDGLYLGLMAGANVLMPDFTPARWQGDYALYDHKAHIALAEARSVIARASRRVAGWNKDPGPKESEQYAKHA
jgi:biotin synthase